MNSTFDCIVVGGGPAGSTVAALVARAGFRTLLLEREKMPRFHAGESLVCESFWTLERLGVLEAIAAAGFPKKHSLQLIDHAGHALPPFYVHHRDPRDCSQTWQVVRSAFDEILWTNALAQGAICRDRAPVSAVVFDGRRAVGVRISNDQGDEKLLRGRVIVDATGQQSLLAGTLGLREEAPPPRKAAVWGYYENARRDAGIDEGATLILQSSTRKAWFWYVPLPDNVVSVGVVGDADRLLASPHKPESPFEEELVHCPAVLERLVDARLRCEFRVLKDFSYFARQASGDGWVLVGDALASLEPIFSSGVFLALKSGELAADAIVKVLQVGDTSAEPLGNWSDRFSQGLDRLRKLTAAFYNERFAVGEFLARHPVHAESLTDLFAGKIFQDGANAVFEDLDAWLGAPSGKNS